MADRELVCICGKTFTTDNNAQKYCSEKCRRAANRKKPQLLSEQVCEFCGKIFSYPRKKKYCSDICCSKANGKGTVYKSNAKKNPTMTIEQIASASRKEGLSYGQYVAKYGL